MIIINKIKTKEIIKGTIKNIDKSAIAVERTKDALVNIKEKSENAYSSDSSVNEYASDKVSFASNRTLDESIAKFNIKGRDSVIETKENIKKAKTKVKTIKSKLSEKRKINKATKGIKNTKKALKSTKKFATETVKTTNRARKLAQETIRKTITGIKVIAKATVSTVKAIIAGTKALISAIIAGGWVAVIIIIVVCLIGLLCSSIFGIFFSSEDTGGGITMNDVVAEINKEMSDKIKNIQDTNIHDDIVVESDRAEWKEILSLYTVKISKGTNEVDVITIDDIKKSELKKIFWDMNDVSFEVKEETNNEEELKKILYIKVTSKSLEEMIRLYNFTSVQKEQVSDLLSNEYSSLWSSVIFGTPVGSLDMVQIALTQVGNVGGEPYWSWYGFNSRVEWCAIFVSWVGQQAGYIETGIIPKFSGCSTGVNWFKALGQWQEKGYIPKDGDIIFFDWEVDGMVNHVGIVEKVENNIIYTIEGNSTDDTCRKQQYNINSNVIFGFGIPAY